MIKQINYTTIGEAELGRLFDHCYFACSQSGQAILTALAAHRRREPLATPLWALREAHNDNLNRFELIMAEIERRQIP